LPHIVDSPNGVIVSVNVGRTRRWARRKPASGYLEITGVGPVRKRGVNLDGDEQADRQVHGRHDKAVYAYDRGHPLVEAGSDGIGPGGFGNLTVQGLHLVDSVVGERWTVGTAVLE
jgi:MOSC domain-containing protein YiiM